MEVNHAYIVQGRSEIFQDEEWSAATQVLCPEANGARHTALVIYLCQPPCVLYVVVCTRLNRQLIFISLGWM